MIDQTLLVGLDFDGTLAHLTSLPEAATMDPSARDAVHKLLRRPRTSVAIISGRALTDLRARCGFANAIYAGNHGFEIESPTLHFIHPEAAAARSSLQTFSRRARQLLTRYDVLVEDKRLSLSVHYRRIANAAERIQVIETVSDLFDSSGAGLRLTHGKCVLEIRPDVDWNKGSALQWIASQIEPRPYLIYAGDDQTDEDAYRVASVDGRAIQVGHPRRSSAATEIASSVEALAVTLSALAE